MSKFSTREEETSVLLCFFTSSLLFPKRSDGLKIAAEEILEKRSDKHLSGAVLVELILPRGRETGSMIFQGPSTLSPVTQNNHLEPFTSLSPHGSLCLDDEGLHWGFLVKFLQLGIMKGSQKALQLHFPHYDRP